MKDYTEELLANGVRDKEQLIEKLNIANISSLNNLFKKWYGLPVGEHLKSLS